MDRSIAAPFPLPSRRPPAPPPAALLELLALRLIASRARARAALDPAVVA